jgi:alpha-glucuronidase
VTHYAHGADAARGFEQTWIALAGRVDRERHRAVLAKLHQQAADAAAWRDKCLAYFQTFSHRPWPGPSSAAAPPPGP